MVRREKVTNGGGEHSHRSVGEFTNPDLLGARALCGFGESERGAKQQN
jgi:hypothetical protein